MHILVVNYEYPPLGGGGGFVTRDILEHIAGIGHHVSIITSGYNGLPSQEVINGVEVVRVPVLRRTKIETATNLSMLSYVPFCVYKFKSLSGRKFDIINTHFAVPSGPAGHMIAKYANLPNVLSIHGGDIFDPSKFFSPHKIPGLKQTVRKMLNAADRVVAQSTDTKNNALHFYGIKRPVDIIPLGIKKPIFQRRSRKELGYEKNETLIVAIGRLVARKNLSETLIVLAAVKKRHNFKFIIIGDGPARTSLEEQVSQLGLRDNVHFKGTISDEEKFQLLNIANLYISTAMHEGFGLVFLEAMECGLPIVCYNRGGQTDFLLNGETGFVTEFGNQKAFVENVLSIISNPDMQANIGANNKKLAPDFYISNCAEKYISLFEQVIRKYNSKSDL